MRSLSAERLREVLSYDPLTGEFRWLVSTARRIRVGDIAGFEIDRGRRGIKVDGSQYQAHRLAFLHMTGNFPDIEVDHIDTDPSNNRWANLREATRSENNANTRRNRRNTSGYKGVSWHKRDRKWCAQIHVSGRDIHLGQFSSPEEAHAAYVAAATKHFGEFARAA